MRNMMAGLGVLVMFSSQDLFASAKTDSLVAFLGGAQAKVIWLKWAWCTDDYKPKAQAAAEAEGWSMELLDTKAGAQRTLVTGLQKAFSPRMSHMGKWATYIEGPNSYIVDLTAASPTNKVLLSKSDCTYWAASAFWVDPADGTEYVYCLDNADFGNINDVIGDGTGIYKVKLNSAGTADRSTAVKLKINSTSKVDLDMSVSADGRKLGGAFPWPNPYILDIATGNLSLRHHSGSAFGCQANLAPDNSYRFFHCEDDHVGYYMFDAAGTSDWFFDPRKNLVGLSKSTLSIDFQNPRWSNHVQYYTDSWPSSSYVQASFNYLDLSTEFYAADGSSLWSKDANWVKTQMDMDHVMQVYIGKFSPDFKTHEKTFSIGRDPRYFQARGDTWICDGTTYGSQCTSVSSSPAIRGNHLRGLSVVQNGVFVNVEADGKATVRITDARGRQARQVTGSGSIAVDTRDLAVGAYIISAYQQGNRLTKQVMIAR